MWPETKMGDKGQGKAGLLITNGRYQFRQTNYLMFGRDRDRDLKNELRLLPTFLDRDRDFIAITPYLGTHIT